MSKIIKSWIISVMLVSILVCPVRAGQEKINFDPFATEPNLSVSNESTPGPVIPQVDFNNNDISMVFQIISDATGWSIFPTDEVSKKKISLWAKNITALELLDRAVSLAGFTYHRQDNIIAVMTYEEYMQNYGLEKKIIPLRYGNASSMEASIKPFLTKLARAVVHKESNTIILYEMEANLKYILPIIENLDIPIENAAIEVFDIKYADSQVMAETLQKMFPAKEKMEMPSSLPPLANSANQTTPPAILPFAESNILSNPQSPIGVYFIGRTNQLIVKAYKPDMEIIRRLITKLDTYLEPVTKNYHFSYVDVSEIYTGLERIMSIYAGYGGSNVGTSGMSGSMMTGTGRSGLTLVEKSNSILLTASPGAHRVMESIKESIDTASTFETGMIRVYKIENANVEEVAKTIQEILISQEKEMGETTQAKFNKSSASPDGPMPVMGPSSSRPEGDTTASEEVVSKIQTSVSVNKSTNSVVVMATARQQREIELLIQNLDKRRRQVLIEAKIIEITTTDNLNLGVELNHAKDDISLFTQFGLSKNLDPATGGRSIIVGEGGTAAVLKPEQIQVIIQALKSDSNIRITSAPQILVNDNSAGLISSVAERPYTTTSQGQNSDQTTFAGFVKAGTEFQIIPHISEKDFLRVEYVITLNSFTGSSSDLSIPPPRSTSSIQSEATVPDGHTIVVGGLQRVDDTETIKKVPLLGDIPVLEWLFKSTTKEKTKKTIFLFITPTILANEKFEDIRRLSDNALKIIKADKDPNRQVDIADVNTPQ
jgi:type II secretion system protein D